MKSRAELLTFIVLYSPSSPHWVSLLRRGVHGQSTALAIALMVILLLRVGIFAWNLRRQRAQLQK